MERTWLAAAVGGLLIALFIASNGALAEVGQGIDKKTGNSGDTIEISTGPTAQDVTTGQASDESFQFGLLPLWQQAYNGSGTHNYDFDGDGQATTQQCGNCHLGGGSKHEAPLHPIGLGPNDMGNVWFIDQGRQMGPNVKLMSQPAGITPRGQNAFCGDCHTPSNPSGFADPDQSGRTSDPHSVHRDVISREGCVRCHTGNQRTFQGEVTFTQGNASAVTNGIANPINMTRIWDGKFLSAKAEATYGPDGGDTGSGWNKYKSNDSQGAVQQGCGDCHSQFHKNGGLSFAFDDSTDNRKGPVKPIEHDESPGITPGGNVFTCGDCHVTDAHAVHTNGQLNSRVNFFQASDMNATIKNANVRGAEMCPQCHGQEIASQNGGHFSPQAAQLLGLIGQRNAPPDAESQTYGNPAQNEDCGFCHQ